MRLLIRGCAFCMLGWTRCAAWGRFCVVSCGWPVIRLIREFRPKRRCSCASAARRCCCGAAAAGCCCCWPPDDAEPLHVDARLHPVMAFPAPGHAVQRTLQPALLRVVAAQVAAEPAAAAVVASAAEVAADTQVAADHRSHPRFRAHPRSGHRFACPAVSQTRKERRLLPGRNLAAA